MKETKTTTQPRTEDEMDALVAYATDVLEPKKYFIECHRFRNTSRTLLRATRIA